MNPETQQAETEKTIVEVKVEEPGALTKIQSPDRPPDQWQQIRDQILEYLSDWQYYLVSFFSDYQKPIINIGLFVASLVTIYITLAVLDAINDIPLLAPTFELIGLGYTAWFVNRYLLRASNRQELWVRIEAFKNQIFGQNAPNT